MMETPELMQPQAEADPASSRRCARKSHSSAAQSLGSPRSGRQSTFPTTATRWDTLCARLQRRHKP